MLRKSCNEIGILGKFIVCVALVLVFIGVCFPTFNTNAAQQEVRVTVDGRQVRFSDQRPVIINGRVLVPIRDVFEELGFQVRWDSATETAILSNAQYTVHVPLNRYTFTTNGISHVLDVPAQIINDRTMLPIRALVESVGYMAEWDSANNTAVITSVRANVDLSARTIRIDGTDFTRAQFYNSFAVDGYIRFNFAGYEYGAFFDRYAGVQSFDSFTTMGTTILMRSSADNDYSQPTPPQHDIYIPSEPEVPAYVPAPVATPGFVDINGIAPVEKSDAEWRAVLQGTTSSFSVPNRRLTDTEMQNWIDEYNSLGGMNAFELEIVRLTNEIRVAYGLEQLELDLQRSLVARLHSQTMVDLSLPLGHSVGPYRGATGIAIAWGLRASSGNGQRGRMTPAGVLYVLMGSPIHRANILTEDWTHIGVGSFGSTHYQILGNDEIFQYWNVWEPWDVFIQPPNI